MLSGTDIFSLILKEQYQVFQGKKVIALTNRDSYFSNKNKRKIYFSQA
jgi:hypothetical protein